MTRLEAAEARKDWADVSDILDNATRKDLTILKGIIPRMILHCEWIVRASVILTQMKNEPCEIVSKKGQIE